MSEANAARSIAFFDVDNTLIRGASLYHLGVGAWRRRMVTWPDIASFAWKQARFIAVGENRVHLATVRERALEVVAGQNRADLLELSREVFDARLIRLLWPATVAVARTHLAAGREVWLVTATAQEVADVIAERLGFTGALGTVLETVEGVFTGRLIDGVCHGAQKAAAARAQAARSQANLAACWAYSDSHNDIPLLDLVGNPVVVNPDATLHRYATARHWPIMLLKRGSITAAARASKKR
jgi:HAD superfamily hydrolase (TIGR01490 family)